MSWWIVTWKEDRQLRAATFPSKEEANTLYRKLPTEGEPYIGDVLDAQKKWHDA